MDEVRRLRLEKGWSQNELAYHAKLAPSVISLIETGKRDPNATTLRKLAEALEVRIPDLFEESGSGKAQRRSSPEPSLFNGVEDERREALEILFDNLRIHITGTADRWIHAAETGLLFWSEDAAIAYSIEVNDEAAHLYGFVSEALEPALEKLFAGTLTLRSEQRKLIQAVEHLSKAVEMAKRAADAAAPTTEPTEEEWAAFAEVAEKLWEEMDEVKQRRLLREVAEVLAAECEQAAAGLRERLA